MTTAEIYFRDTHFQTAGRWGPLGGVGWGGHRLGAGLYPAFPRPGRAACMPGSGERGRHQEVEGRGSCLAVDRWGGEGGSGAGAFPSPGPGWEDRAGVGRAMLTSTGAQTSLEAAVGGEGKQGQAQVLSSVPDRRELSGGPAHTTAPALWGLDRPEDLGPSVLAPDGPRQHFSPLSHSSRPGRPPSFPRCLGPVPGSQLRPVQSPFGLQVPSGANDSVGGEEG